MKLTIFLLIFVIIISQSTQIYLENIVKESMSQRMKLENRIKRIINEGISKVNNISNKIIKNVPNLIKNRNIKKNTTTPSNIPKYPDWLLSIINDIQNIIKNKKIKNKEKEKPNTYNFEFQNYIVKAPKNNIPKSLKEFKDQLEKLTSFMNDDSKSNFIKVIYYLINSEILFSPIFYYSIETPNEYPYAEFNSFHSTIYNTGKEDSNQDAYKNIRKLIVEYNTLMFIMNPKNIGILHNPPTKRVGYKKGLNKRKHKNVALDTNIVAKIDIFSDLFNTITSCIIKKINIFLEELSLSYYT